MGTALTISYSALNAAEESEVASLDSQISSVIDAGLAPGADKLQAVSTAAEQSGGAITVAFITFEGDITVLNESQVTFKSPPTDSQLKDALDNAVRIEGTDNYLMKSLAYSDIEYVVAATSLDAVIENKSQNSRRFLGLSFLSSAIGAIIVWLLIRRDVRVINRLITKANDIADGLKEVSLPEPRGSTEVSELTVALSHMIESLKDNHMKCAHH
jgi:methyl-accepting chemotaxis protein